LISRLVMLLLLVGRLVVPVVHHAILCAIRSIRVVQRSVTWLRVTGTVLIQKINTFSDTEVKNFFMEILQKTHQRGFILKFVLVKRSSREITCSWYFFFWARAQKLDKFIVISSYSLLN